MENESGVGKRKASPPTSLAQWSEAKGKEHIARLKNGANYWSSKASNLIDQYCFLSVDFVLRVQ